MPGDFKVNGKVTELHQQFAFVEKSNYLLRSEFALIYKLISFRSLL